MTWRYQPVWGDDGPEAKWFSVCEVYLDESGKLKSWTGKPAVAAMGDSLNGLVKTLDLMRSEALKYKAVKHDEITVGMVFELTDGGQL